MFKKLKSLFAKKEIEVTDFDLESTLDRLTNGQYFKAKEIETLNLKPAFSRNQKIAIGAGMALTGLLLYRTGVVREQRRADKKGDAYLNEVIEIDGVLKTRREVADEITALPASENLKAEDLPLLRKSEKELELQKAEFHRRQKELKRERDEEIARKEREIVLEKEKQDLIRAEWEALEKASLKAEETLPEEAGVSDVVSDVVSEGFVISDKPQSQKKQNLEAVSKAVPGKNK